MQAHSGFWLMKPFSTVFILVLAGSLLLLTAASLLLRKKSEKVKKAVILAACAITVIGFFLYKYYLSLDSDFAVITADMGGFNWWGELPLQLCNINMILIPVAVIKDSRSLKCFCFFLAPLGALMALLMPANGFNGYSLLLPRMLGYYGTHFMLVIEGLALVSFGLYRPRYRDLPRALLTAVIIAFAIYLVNLFLRAAGLHPKANYFFAVETEGNFLLEIFHRWIPVPFLFLLPSILILGPYMVLVTAPFALADRKREYRDNNGT